MKSTFVALILSLCLIISTTTSLAARPEPLTGKDNIDGRFYFNIPGFDFFPRGFGFVCLVKGPCYKKKLKCPAKCFTSYGSVAKGGAFGGGGGACRFDCKTKCIAYC